MESHLINTTAFDQDLPAHFSDIPPHLFYFLIISPASLSLSIHANSVPPTAIKSTALATIDSTPQATDGSTPVSPGSKGREKVSGAHCDPDYLFVPI